MSKSQPRRTNVQISIGCALVWSLCLATAIPDRVAADDELSCTPADGAVESAQPVRVVPATSPEGEIEMAPRAPAAVADAEDGVIVLNTRGYNYGPDRPTVRPEAAESPAVPADRPKD